jgi:hypothetical protein
MFLPPDVCRSKLLKNLFEMKLHNAYCTTLPLPGTIIGVMSVHTKTSASAGLRETRRTDAPQP